MSYTLLLDSDKKLQKTLIFYSMSSNYIVIVRTFNTLRRKLVIFHLSTVCVSFAFRLFRKGKKNYKNSTDLSIIYET